MRAINIPQSLIPSLTAARASLYFDANLFAEFVRWTGKDVVKGVNDMIAKLYNLPETWLIEEFQIERAMLALNDLGDALSKHKVS